MKLFPDMMTEPGLSRSMAPAALLAWFYKKVLFVMKDSDSARSVSWIAPPRRACKASKWESVMLTLTHAWH